MEKNGELFIKLRLGEIHNSYHNICPTFNKGKLVGLKIKNPYIIYKEILFLLLFMVSGPLIILLFHLKGLSFFNYFINDDFTNPNTYVGLNNNLISRIIIFLISILISIGVPLLILLKIKNYLELLNIITPQETTYFWSYEWEKIYKSINKIGYMPDNFKDGYLKVEKINGLYVLLDGNHRHFILTHLYGQNKVIKVKLEKKNKF